MDIPLIYKYKPSKFCDFVMSNNYNELLNTLINMNNLNILLIGPSGCGKTSLINCIIHEYYNNKIDHNNILYINCLKEQGIQYYRNEVKTFCQTRSNLINKKKIVLLDDIDNINEQSQQVFRNCIDKYNNNIQFICSCSNIQKIIDSMQSRLIIIKLNPIERNNLKLIANNIIEKENIVIKNQLLDQLINISNNSIRLLINYIEKIKLLDNSSLTDQEDFIDNICSNISFNIFDNYTKLAREKKYSECIQILYNLYDDGYSVMDILDNYFNYVKINDGFKDDIKFEIVKLLCKYITIFHNIHEDEIELACFTNNLIQIL